jgi:branched-chain amino acid transport system substrate-binding protein
MKFRYRYVRAVGVLAIVAAAAACSSSSKPSSSSSSTTAGSQSTSAGSTGASASGAPLKVGVICSCSGPFGTNIAPAADVARAWASSVNDSGGLNGHPIQLTVLDDSSNPATSATDATQLVSDHVDVILDDTVLDVVWASTASSAKIPVVGGNFSSEPFYTNPDFYPSGQTNDSITYSNVSVAKQAGATNIGNLYCAEAAQCQQSVPLMAAAGKQLGVPAVYNASISATAPNYTAQCLAAQQQHVTSLFIGDSASVIAKVGQNCSTQGYKPIYITEGTGFSMQLAQSPGIKDNLWSDYPDLPFWAENPIVTTMNSTVDKYKPGLRNNTLGWTEYAVQTWTAGLLIQDAFKGSGIGASDTPSAAAMTTGLDSISNDNLGGWAPPLTFTAGQPHKVDCWFVGQVHNGTPSLVNGGKLSCQSGSA